MRRVSVARLPPDTSAEQGVVATAEAPTKVFFQRRERTGRRNTMFGRGEEDGGGINATRAREWPWRGPLDCGNVRRVSPVSLLPLPPPPPLPLEPRGGGAVLPAGPARLFTPSHYGGARLETCSFTFISIYLCLSPPRPVHLFIFLFFRFFFLHCLVQALRFSAHR